MTVSNDHRPKRLVSFADPRIGACLIIGVSLLFYGNSMLGEFTYDDESSLAGTSAIREHGGSVRSWLPPRYNHLSRELSYRPVVTLSYLAQVKFWELTGMAGHSDKAAFDPLPLKAGNWLLHVASALLLWLIARKYMDPLPSLFAALVFSVCPVTTEAVNSVGFREDLLVLVFLEAAALLYLRWTRLRSAGALGLALACFLLAIMSKENAYVFPGILVCIVMAPPKDSPSGRAAWYGLVPFIVATAVSAYLFLVLLKAPAVVRYPWLDGYNGPKLALVGPLIVEHLKILFGATPPVVDRSFVAVEQGSIARMTAITAAVVAIPGCAALLAWKKRSALLPIMGWILLPLIPVCGIVPLHSPVADRYCYLPCAGIGLLAGWLGSRAAAWLTASSFGLLSQRLQVPFVAASLVVLALGTQTASRNLVWSSQDSLWSTTLLENPRSPHANQNVGVGLLRRGYSGPALRYLEAADRLDPTDVLIKQDLSVAYMMRGQPEQARSTALKAAELEPAGPDLLHNLAKMYLADPGSSLELADRYYELALKAGHARDADFETRMAKALLQRK